MVEDFTQYDEKIDRTAILERLEGSQDLLVELVQLFEEEAPQLIEAMHNALRRADMQELGRAAHSMKGAAGNFSARGTVIAASQLEIHAKNGDVASANVSLAALKITLESLLLELADMCQGSAK
jgi:HPt (histidine-containing phosphotransfer) domain-containing protein